MNIVTEPHLAGEPIADKPRPRPVRMLRWFIIIGLSLTLLVGGLVGFNAFRSHMIAQFFANNKPPPATVTIAEAQSEVVPNLLTAVGDLIAPVFAASLDSAVAVGDASRIGTEPLNLFWFAHHTVLMAALARLPAVPCLSYGNAADLELQLCEFLLRGIGLNEAAIASHLKRELPPDPKLSATAESA